MRSFEELIEEIRQEKLEGWEKERALSQERYRRKSALMKKQKVQKIHLFKEMGLNTGPLEKIPETGRAKKKNRESLRTPVLLDTDHSGTIPARIYEEDAIEVAMLPPGIRTLPVHSVSYYSGKSSDPESKVLKNTRIPGPSKEKWIWVAEGSEEDIVDLTATFTYNYVYYPLVTRPHQVRFVMKFYGTCTLNTSTDFFYCPRASLMEDIDIRAGISCQTECFQELPSGTRIQIHSRDRSTEQESPIYDQSTTICLEDGQYVDEINIPTFRDRWFPLRRLQKTVFTNTIRLHCYAYGRDSRAELNFSGADDYIWGEHLLVVDGQENYWDRSPDLTALFPWDSLGNRPFPDPDYTIPYPG